MHGRLAIWTLTASVAFLIALVIGDMVFEADAVKRMNSTAYHLTHQNAHILHHVDDSHPHTKAELKTKRPVKCCPGCYDLVNGPLVLPDGLIVSDEEAFGPTILQEELRNGHR